MKPLRVLLLCPTPDKLEPWAWRLLRHLRTWPWVEVVGRQECKTEQPTGLANLFWKVLGKLEKFPVCVPTALEQEWLSQLQQTSEQKPDVVVCLGEVPSVLPASNHGVLSVGQAHAWHYGLHEVSQRHDKTLLTILQHTAERVSAVQVGQFATQGRWLFNRTHTLEQAVALLQPVLHRLAMQQPLVPVAKVAERADVSVWDMLSYVARVYPPLLVRKGIAKFWRACGFWPNVWQLGVLQGDVTQPETLKLRLLPQPRGVMRADPFVFEHNGTRWVFFEELAHGAPYAHIAVAKWENGVLGEARVVLKKAHHLSYPQVFQWGDEVLMLPETHGAKQVEVWRAVEFPHTWELYQTAFVGESIADATLWQDAQGKTWLMVNRAMTHVPDHSGVLEVYAVGDTLLESLTLHPANPVVVDCEVARSGGPWWDYGGNTLRPSQQFMHGRYGAALNVMQVNMDKRSYAEHRLAEITPQQFGRGLNGLHHLCPLSEHMYVVDVRHAWRKR